MLLVYLVQRMELWHSLAASKAARELPSNTYLVANLDPVTSKNDFCLVQGVVLLLQDMFSKRYGFWLL